MSEIAPGRTTPETLQAHDLQSQIIAIRSVIASIEYRGLPLESDKAAAAVHSAEQVLAAIEQMNGSDIHPDCVEALSSFVRSYQNDESSKKPEIESIWHSL